jgi:hypothetical protein
MALGIKNRKFTSKAIGWREAENALAVARQMPGGSERVAALKKAGQLRFQADERRRIRRERKEQREQRELGNIE